MRNVRTNEIKSWKKSLRWFRMKWSKSSAIWIIEVIGTSLSRVRTLLRASEIWPGHLPIQKTRNHNNQNLNNKTNQQLGRSSTNAWQWFSQRSTSRCQGKSWNTRKKWLNRLQRKFYRRWSWMVKATPYLKKRRRKMSLYRTNMWRLKRINLNSWKMCWQWLMILSMT